MSGRAILLTLAGAIVLMAPQPAPACDSMACFPSCQPDDGRFLVITGSGLSSLAAVPTKVRFEPHRLGKPFVISVFDGDMRRDTGTNYWDYGNVYYGQDTWTRFTLSPCPDLSCAQLGAPIATATCGDMPDNAWYTFRVAGDHPAYILTAELDDPDVLAFNQFKLRTTGHLLLTRDEQPFAFEAGLLSTPDLLTVFPEMDPLDLGRGDLAKVQRNMVGARYDGTFTFPIEVDAACTGGVPEPDDCGCEGKVSQLTLRYTGSLTDAHVRVEQKKDQVVVFDATVPPAGEFSFVGADKKSTLGTEILLFINGQLDTKIHTSCSQPIGPGLAFGDFLVVGGRSREGGVLCPLGEDDSDSDSDSDSDCDSDPANPQTLELWDGDLDRGGYDGAPLDTDDPDTPPTEPAFCAKLPDYARRQVQPEGVALGLGLGMGNPPDEMDPSANDWLNRYICRPPSVEVTVFAPDGRTFVNDNPSGDQEWER